MTSIELINFTLLSLEEKKMVLKWRNNPNIKRWMYDKNNISLKNHLNYIEFLKTKKDRIYFLVKEEENSVGVIDFTSIDYLTKSAEIGLYSNPLLKGYGKILMNKIIN